jgi:hypothetical protein
VTHLLDAAPSRDVDCVLECESFQALDPIASGQRADNLDVPRQPSYDATFVDGA